MRAATAAGVTRLADVTGLDRIGVPVWQAVRPRSRSVTTHQGKGWTIEQAQLSALMEAIECDAAESWTGPARRAAWNDLPLKHRVNDIGAFGIASAPLDPAAVISWTLAEPLGSSPPFYVPIASVSLDTTIVDAPPGLRSSNGQAAHFDLDAAMLKALLELIERDATTEMLEGNPNLRTLYRCDPPAERWFADIEAVLTRLGIELRLHRPPTLAGCTTIVVELLEPDAAPAPHAWLYGSAAAADPITALHGALLEVIQCRASYIAWVRDDLLVAPASMDAALDEAIYGLEVLPTLSSPDPWENTPPPTNFGVESIIAALASYGFGQAGCLVLPTADPSIHAVKCIVPGLAAPGRRRRPC